MARAAVATSQPLAAQAGLRMLLAGGNAVDAALAAAMALTVVEPTGCGIGGDLFALVWDGARLHGLNASGRAPAAWTPERFAGRKEMPLLGWDAVTVPGTVSGWAALSRRFGRLPMTDLCAPAADYARQGFAVSPLVAARWADAAAALGRFPAFAAAFLTAGRPPAPGEIFRCPDQARSLEAIAASGGEDFYRGALAGAMARCAAAEGGALTLDDLQLHRPEWVAPLSCPYRGAVLHELPPNGQGLAALVALGILERLEAGPGPDAPETLHRQVEAMKIAFSLVHRHVAEPAAMTIDPRELLDPALLAQQAARIRSDRALPPDYLLPREGGTVYLAAADAAGMMVSLIQSNFAGFGSGVVVPGTGIALHNRGSAFNLIPGHPNRVGGGKRPYHTIIPAFLTAAGGQPLAAMGVMGAHMQPQGHVQLVTRMVDHRQNPQAAIDAPRWHVLPDGRLALEAGLDPAAVRGLRERGHLLLQGEPPWGYGGAQIVWRSAGGYVAASDPRKDGQAVGF
jgi:gamma-glutamyltranspeptidase/glutathione hydrolase